MVNTFLLKKAGSVCVIVVNDDGSQRGVNGHPLRTENTHALFQSNRTCTIKGVAVIEGKPAVRKNGKVTHYEVWLHATHSKPLKYGLSRSTYIPLLGEHKFVLSIPVIVPASYIVALASKQHYFSVVESLKQSQTAIR